jgi:UDP-glucose 4-epimerase
LLAEGHEVVVISRTASGQMRDAKCRYICADITRQEDFSKWPTQAEAVFHLAAYIPRDDIFQVETSLRVNVFGMWNVLQYCHERGVDSLIHSSSISVYEEPRYLPVDEEHPTRPYTFYGMTKLCAELLSVQLAKAYGLSCTILRYSSVYGAGQKPNSVLPVFVHNVLQGQSPTVFGSGQRTQDFVYVKEVVSANVAAFRSRATGIYNIGSGVETTMLELAQVIVDVFAPNLRVKLDTTCQEFATRFYLDITKAKRDMGYRAAYSLREGLEDYRTQLRGSSQPE